jgi:Txe/YoeB family toxin of Txe-Axe toxin-antitoxin module
MTDEEREFWKAAFLAALSTVIRMPWETNGKPDPLSAETFAIVAGRIADESLRELREMGHATDTP